MAKKPDEPRLHAWESLLRAHHGLVRRLGVELEREHQLSMSWYEVLLRLNRADEKRLRMQELAESTFFSPSGMTRLIDRMCEADLVERHVCDSDRRGVWVRLTPEGKERLRAASTTHLRGIQQHFGAAVSDDEAQAISRSLSRVADALSS